MLSSKKSRVLKIKTSDNEIFEVEEAVATMSKTIKIMAEDCSGEVIPLNNVHSTIFARVIEWCKKHVDDGEDLEYYKGALKNWDATFFEVDQAVLYHLLTAANSLDIKPLLHQGCQRFVDMINGKTVEEIRQLLHIKNDFTNEEEDETLKKLWSSVMGMNSFILL
ncbi:SKP1-like protein 1A [Durio zibethinus]|uniref:SKP1-like protein n=1 Tax=Durio zibethinus TaxID=66656 RepID=A0A6P6A3I2_DURZI|nr:SKP1-like protein 1A [Durio zibethinus]